MSTHRVGPADLIIYRLAHKLVYVKPPATYEEALTLAQTEFSEELGTVDSSRIRFFIVAGQSQYGESPRVVRISEGAWPSAVARMHRGEIVDLELRPDPNQIVEKRASISLELPPRPRREGVTGPTGPRPGLARRKSSQVNASNRKWFGLK